MERERRLQAGHWYLVADEHGQADIRAYMDDGWYPLTPEPKYAVCEMSRSHHPDNVDPIVDSADDVEVPESDQAIIEHHYPIAISGSPVSKLVWVFAERISRANGADWEDLDSRANYLAISTGFIKQTQDNTNPPTPPMLGVFRPKRWPTKTTPQEPVPVG